MLSSLYFISLALCADGAGGFSPHYVAFGGISVAHYTYFISCVRPCGELDCLLVSLLAQKLGAIYALTNGIFIAF